MQEDRALNRFNQVRRILALLKDENPGKWVPCFEVANPHGDGQILAYGRAIHALRHGRFGGLKHNIQNRTERQPDGSVHGFFCWLPGEWQKSRAEQTSSRAQRAARFEREFRPRPVVPAGSTTNDLPLFGGGR